ncbi:hypothetical protein BASA81_004162 [Batrachochytrium salamandrivorans]|nr:hypothetical protein BASA81_004162 [Batrachochytrium salamandrivorans]
MDHALTALLECPLCLSMLTQPVCTPCGHTFCSACLSRSLTASSTQSVCPICRSPCYAQPGYERAKRQPVVVLEKIVQLLADRQRTSLVPALAEFNLGLFICDEADFSPVPNRAIKIRAFEPQVVLLMNRCAQHGARFGFQSALDSAKGLLVRVDAIQPLRHSSELMADCFVEGIYEVVAPPTREPTSELYTCVARELDLAAATVVGGTRSLVEQCVALFTAKLAVGGQELSAQVFQDPYLRNVVHTLPNEAVALSYFLLDVLDVDMDVRFEPDVNARLEYLLGAMGDAETGFKCERRTRQTTMLGSFTAMELSRSALFVAGWLVLVGVVLGGFDSVLQTSPSAAAARRTP